MNVYVRELTAGLAQSGVQCRVYVRRWSDALPEVVQVEPGLEVVHISAGPVDAEKEDLEQFLDEFAAGCAADMVEWGADVIHANYWLSGIAGLRLKQQLGLPLVVTFHTLARVKAQLGDPEPEHRAQAEAAVIGCADVVVANGQPEAEQLVSHYDCKPGRIEIVPPGVDHAFFSPGSQAGARFALDAGDDPLLLFVGRIQPLKGVDVAVGALAELDVPTARLWVVGGASGQAGQAELVRLRRLAQELGVADRVRFFRPQPHHLLSTYLRAADVVLVPSRSESFGLVALESAACGVPVVASAVGGLLSLVDHGRTGYLIEGRDPVDYATAVQAVLSDPLLARKLSVSAAGLARTYTWTDSARRLGELYFDVVHVHELVPCG